MSKACPICQLSPAWHYARGTSINRNFGQPIARRTHYFLFTGCKHAESFGAGIAEKFVADKDRASVEERWDAHAETLFAGYTATWTEAQKNAFRHRLWPLPHPVIPNELIYET